MARRTRKPEVKVTPISQLDEFAATGGSPTLSSSLARTVSDGCDCPCKTVIERPRKGHTILRCPQCGVIHNVVSGGQRLEPGSYCRWCGREDLPASIGRCDDSGCHPSRKKKRSQGGFPVVCSKCGELQRGRVVALSEDGACQSCYDEKQRRATERV